VHQQMSTQQELDNVVSFYDDQITLVSFFLLPFSLIFFLVNWVLCNGYPSSPISFNT
jgi:hypothetical protein